MVPRVSRLWSKAFAFANRRQIDQFENWSNSNFEFACKECMCEENAAETTSN